MENEKDKRSRNIGLLASTLIHGGLALLLFLLVAWKAPNPPNPEYGVEINLGFSDEGSGDVQPTEPVGNEGVSDEAASQPEQTQPQPETKQEVTPSQQEVVTDENNPVSVEEKKKDEPKEEVVKEKPKEIKPKPIEEKKKEITQEAVYNPTETTKTTADQKKGENLSQGNDQNKKGDKGQPDGTLNTDALYKGKPGGGSDGSGPGLDLAGWMWDRRPNPKMPENESGTLVFEIEVDDDGEIIGLRTLQRGLSGEAERICREEIRKLTFSSTGSGTPKGAKGKITFVVKAQ